VAISSLNGGRSRCTPTGGAPLKALLLRGKMLDVEDELQKKRLSPIQRREHGDFSTMAPRVRLVGRS